jgi:3-oxoadipate enol-lactonase
MYYEVHGEDLGQTAVLIHPIGGNTEIWNDEIRIMRDQGSRVIAYDLRGHGRSEIGKIHPYTMQDLVNDLRNLLNHLQVGKCTLIGHSIGGQIACIFAVSCPERVNGLIIISSSSEPIPDKDLEKHHDTRRIAREKGMEALAEETMQEHEIARQAFENKAKRNTFTKIFTKTTVEGFSAATVALYSIPSGISRRLAALSIPISGIVGTDDEVFVRLMNQMRAEIPRLNLMTIKGDHWVIVESHEAFDRAFMEALENAMPLHAGPKLDRKP